jgi:hypothetical protein
MMSGGEEEVEEGYKKRKRKRMVPLFGVSMEKV